MPPITRIGDLSTGHDACPPVPAITGSATVSAGNSPIVCVGDSYAIHSCPIHSPHNGLLVAGAPFVTIEGKQVGRIGDPISCSQFVAQGLGSVIIGNGGGYE